MKLVKTVVLLSLLAGPLAAQSGFNFTTVTSDSSAPVSVKSAELQADQKTGNAIFVGDVVAEQDVIRLAADRVEVDYNKEEKKVRRMVATGHVIYVTPSEEAESENAIYDPEGGHLEMWGNVLVIQGETAISGDRLKVNLTTGQAEMTGNVRSVFGSR